MSIAFRPIKNAQLRVISLGAGLQSIALALMAQEGKFGNIPDCAIFADTGDEPQYVYDQLEWLKARVDFPVHVERRSEKGLHGDMLDKINDGTSFANVPVFAYNEKGKVSMLRRQCTNEYKISVINGKIIRLLGYRTKVPKKTKVESWMGITTDEITRMKVARQKYLYNRYPLVEAKMSRQDCSDYMLENHGFIPGKSSCVFCPYHSDSYWLWMRENQPEEFERAVQFERDINKLAGVKSSVLRLHRSMKPLDEVEFEPGKENDGFANECEGMCGV